MALIHPLSAECSKSELELFSVPNTQLAISDSKYVEYRPVATLTDGSPIDFQITSAGEDYIDLAETLLCVEAKIVTADDKDLGVEESDKVAPAKYFLNSLF